jgi:type IV fimbrial biogenesis protein FimT
MRHGVDPEKGADVPELSRLGRARADAGFTLIELLVTITLMSLLMALAMPPMTAWIRNSKVRAVGDSVQNGLRLARAESLRRSRQVVFSLTNSNAPQTSVNVAAVANGLNWSINALPTMSAGETSAFVESGVLADVSAGVQLNGPASICFNSLGRLVANTTSTLTAVTGGPTCAVTADASYDITMAGADRRLRVTVGLGGQVRMCDPDKPLSASKPDGCA